MNGSTRHGWGMRWVLCAIAVAILIPIACSDRHRTLPIATAFTPASPARGMITIRHTLRDRSSTFVTIEVLYRFTPKDPWTPTTEGPGSEGTTGLRATPGGVNHVYVWDSLADLGIGFQPRMQIRVLPRRSGKRGTSGLTAEFQVDNTGVFVDSFIDTILPPCAPPLDSQPFTLRDRHTVTALPGGRVLIAGGVDALDNPLASAEVFDPWTGCYDSLGAAMQNARESHVAVALADGRVLIVGGADALGPRDDVEIYRWETRTFTTVGTLSDPKTEFTATRLADGRVMIAGGFDGAAALDSVDLFAPSAPGLGGTIGSALNPLNRPRRAHFAVRLSGTGVLFGGGADLAGAPVPGEVFDPVTETFTDTPAAMAGARAYAGAALLADGTVVIQGGRDPAGTVLETAEIYDPLTNLFTSVVTTPPPPSPREFAAAHSIAGGNAVFLGGSDGIQGVLSADIFALIPFGDCATASTFCEGPGSMPIPRPRPVTTAVHDGRIYVAGGGGLPEIYVPPGPTGGEVFANTDRPVLTRADHTMTTLPGGQVLIAGGDDGVATTNTVEIFDPVTDLFAAGPFPMNSARQGHTATLLPNETVLIAGGSAAGTPLGSMETFNPLSGAFSPVPASLGDPRFDHTASLLPDGRVMIAGGDGGGGTALDTAEIYDPVSGGVAFTAGPLTTARRGHRATALHNGDIFLAAGVGPAGAPIASVEVYDFWVDVFSNVPDPGAVLVPRRLHAAVTLPNGHVLIIGGEDDAGLSLEGTTIYDPVTNPAAPTLAAGPDMDQARSDFTVAIFPRGDVLVAGGFAVTQNFPRAEVFDIDTLTFRTNGGGNMIWTRRGARASLLHDRRLLIVGGRDNQDNPRDRAEIFTP